MTPQAPFRYSLRVRYSECDGQHVVYNAKYGEYFDLAATEFLRAAFAPLPVFDGNFEFQVVKLLVEWTGPARFDDKLDITVRTTRIGNSSFALGFELRRRGDVEPIATGETVNVHVDGKLWTKRSLGAEAKQSLEFGALGKVVDMAG